MNVAHLSVMKVVKLKLPVVEFLPFQGGTSQRCGSLHCLLLMSRSALPSFCVCSENIKSVMEDE